MEKPSRTNPRRGLFRRCAIRVTARLTSRQLSSLVRTWAQSLRELHRLFRPGQKKRSPLAAFQGKLSESARELKQVCAELENDFLTTGTVLERLAVEGQTFVSKSETLVGYATGRANGSTLLFEAMQMVQGPLTFLDSSHPKAQKILERLREDSCRIDELINFQEDLHRTIRPLKHLQTLFKIESAPLGGDVQGMFGALTKDIETLHDQIRELFTTRFQELRGVQQTVNQVIAELQAGTDNLWTNISKEKAQIEKSLGQLQQALIDNQARESRVSQLSKQLNLEIQDVVLGLQFHDIVNQKLQHTFTSVTRIEEQLQSATIGQGLRQICLLELHQLDAVRHDLSQAQTIIKNGIARLLDHLVTADSQCLMLSEFSHLTTSSDGMVQVLFDTFATLREQVAAILANSARAFEQLRSVGGLASDLTAVVRDLSQRIHLIGLNAQVQAAHVHQGVGLEVLSSRTSEISRATNEISKAVAAKLDQLVHDLADDVKALEVLNREALQQQASLDKEGSATEHSLHALRDTALTALNQIADLLDQIRTESQSLSTVVDYVPKAEPALKALESQLQALASAVPTHDATTTGAAQLTEKARNDYTMHSERKIFAEVMGQGFASQAAPAEHVAVELFDLPDEPPRTNHPEARQTQPANDVPASETIQPSPAPASLPAIPQPSSGTLGDNVELF